MDVFEEGGEESFSGEDEFEDGFEEDQGEEIDVWDSLEETMADALEAYDSDEFLGRVLGGISQVAGLISPELTQLWETPKIKA